MIKVEILKAQTKTLEGTSAKTGNDYSFQIQEAWIWTLDPDTKETSRHPQKIELMLDEDAQPYPVGFYELELSSIYVNRRGRLDVAPRLAPVKLPQRTTAAA
jgi:Helix-destabilising protein.